MKFKAKSMLAMAVLLGVLSVGTLAEATTTATINDITVKKKINFGHYWQSYKGSGNLSNMASYNKDAIIWKVVKNNDSTLTLLSEKVLYADAFNPTRTNVWSSSQIKATLNNTMAGNGFAGDAFTAAEFALIVDKTYDVHSYNTSIDTIDGTTTDHSKIYLLDVEDVKDNATIFNGNSSRKASPTEFANNVKMYGNGYTASTLSYDGYVNWWLRSAGGVTDNWHIDKTDGDIERYWSDLEYTVRPALDLNLTNLIFITNFENGKLTATAGNSIKFGEIGETSTLDIWMDDTGNGASRVTGDVAVGNTLKLDGSKVKIAYTGAKGAGGGEFVSALFFDESGYTYNSSASELSNGTLVGYGKGNAEATAASGTTEIDMSALGEGSYKAEIFNENSLMIGKRAEIKGTLGVDTNNKINYTVSPDDLQFAVVVGADNNVILNADGTLSKIISGNGSLMVNANVSTNADNIATEGTNEVTSSAKLAFAGGTLTKDITGDGTAEFNGTVCVADGVQLGTATNNVNGTLDVVEHITASNINFQNGSTLKVDGTKITDTAAITVITSATVASGSKLYVSNAVKDTTYKILDGSGINVSSWTTDGDMGEGFRASYGLVVDTDNTTTAGTGLSEFHIQFKEDTAATGSSDIGNIIANLPAGSEAKAWIDNISVHQPDVQTQGNTINTVANIGSLANVQGGMNAMSSFTSNSIASNIGSESRPMLGNRGQVSGVRNVSANVKDSNAKVEVIEQGRASDVMPTQYEEQKYGKEVWASFIHSKTKIEGMKTGHLEQDSTLQYNGTVVGVDLWSGRHGFGGVALTYGDGNFHSGQMVSKVKNDADYYGISVYNRQDVGKFSFQYDAGFTYAKNDVTMSTTGAEDITAKPKVRAYSAGIKVEEPIKVGRATEVVPFAGARYTFVKSKEYQNSLGLGYDVDNQHLVKIPVGMSLRTKYLDKSGWKLGTTLSGGYSWNLCNRSSQQRVSFGGYSDMIDFDIADRGEYFVNAAVQAEYENLLFELGYNYSKGKTTRSNKWYVNANLGF